MSDDPPTTEFPAVAGDTAPPASPHPRGPRLRPWMWIAPGVVLVAVAAFFGGRAVASSAATSAQPSPSAVSVAPASGSAATPSAPITTPSAPSTAAGPGGTKGSNGSGVKGSSVVGVLTSVSGSTWTLQKADGSSVSVTITAATKYGTKARPETVSAFKTGASVLVVMGKETTGTAGQSAITAKRVVTRAQKSTTRASTPTAAPTTA